MHIFDKMGVQVTGPGKAMKHEIRNGSVNEKTARARSCQMAQIATDKLSSTINKAKSVTDKLQNLIDGGC